MAVTMTKWFLEPLLSISFGLIVVLIYATSFLITHSAVGSPIPPLRSEQLFLQESGQLAFCRSPLLFTSAASLLSLLRIRIRKEGAEIRRKICASAYWLTILLLPLPIYLFYPPARETGSCSVSVVQLCVGSRLLAGGYGVGQPKLTDE